MKILKSYRMCRCLPPPGRQQNRTGNLRYLVFFEIRKKKVKNAKNKIIPATNPESSARLSSAWLSSARLGSARAVGPRPARRRAVGRSARVQLGGGSARLGPVRIRFGSGSDPVLELDPPEGTSGTRSAVVSAVVRRDPPVDDSEAFF